MELVVDTNIITAAILRAGVTRNLAFHNEILLYSPDCLYAELSKHEDEFREKSGLDRLSFRQASSLVLAHVNVLPLEAYNHHAQHAKEIAPDHDDWPFFSVALQKNCPLWSNEKRLKNQKEVKVYSTQELLDALRH